MEEIRAVPDDERFAIHVSENMELRNQLRTGLVEAQGKETDKMPMLVSWPRWLDDGIICMYAADYQNVLRSTIRDTAAVVSDVMEGRDTTAIEEMGKPKEAEETGPKTFTAMNFGALERIEKPVEAGSEDDETEPAS